MDIKQQHEAFKKLYEIFDTPEMQEKICEVIKEYIDNNFVDIKDVKLGDVYYIK